MKSGLSFQYIMNAGMCRLATEQARRMLKQTADNMDYAHEYAEPGYTDPEKGILFANWNDVIEVIGDALERAGYVLEWDDEWATCEDCYRAFRTEPDCWSWTPYYIWISDCELLCHDCARKDPGAYLESIEDEPNKEFEREIEIDPLEHGYKEIGEFAGKSLNAVLKDFHDRGIYHVILEVKERGAFGFEGVAYTR